MSDIRGMCHLCNEVADSFGNMNFILQCKAKYLHFFSKYRFLYWIQVQRV